MIVADILQFLSELQENNTYEWMQAHKSWHKETQAQFEQLLGELIRQLAAADPAVADLQAMELIFRLNRDTRFSHDKSPYNPAFRAHIGPNGRAPIPVGCYLVLSPGQSILGGGLYAAMFREATEQIRQYIAEHWAELDAILHEEAFRQTFTLQGEKLKRLPRQFAADHPAGEYLKHKSWYIQYAFSPAELADDRTFCAAVWEKCRLMQPFNNYLNTALAGFEMPKR